ncbi:MAG: serine hydrolase domain-containing protein [Planctomycetales bacterium]|jgi:CubicO group peptidase (beta-lactamase class C family)
MIKQTPGAIKIAVAVTAFVFACSVTLGSYADDSSTPTTDAKRLYFPTQDKWESVEPASVGWKHSELNAAVDFAMSRKSSGVVILHRGRILAERYQNPSAASFRYRGMLHGKGADGRVIEDVASVQKSVASVLVGIAQEKGLVSIGDPVDKYLGAGWSNATPAQEKQITIKHLISMSTGLSDGLRYADPPGTKWRYNTNAYCLSVRAIAAAAKMTPNELTKTWLTDRVGMNDSRWIERRLAKASIPETNRLGFATSARDLARLGLLVLARGQWENKVVLSDQKYLSASLSPSQKMNPAYGYLWWLNGQKSALRGGRLVRGPLNRQAPSDLVAALGALGRKCYVVPSLDLVVTRLGDNPLVNQQPTFDIEFWRLLMKAAPTARE